MTGVRDLVAGPQGVLDVGGERLLEITGTLINETQAAIHLVRIGVRAGNGDGEVVQQATTVPATIPPGGTAGWSAKLRTGVPMVLWGLVDAQVLSWSWVDETLPACRP